MLIPFVLVVGIKLISTTLGIITRFIQLGSLTILCSDGRPIFIINIHFLIKCLFALESVTGSENRCQSQPFHRSQTQLCFTSEFIIISIGCSSFVQHGQRISPRFHISITTILPIRIIIRSR